jgi:hypothetical protein
LLHRLLSVWLLLAGCCCACLFLVMHMQHRSMRFEQ